MNILPPNAGSERHSRPLPDSIAMVHLGLLCIQPTMEYHSQTQSRRDDPALQHHQTDRGGMKKHHLELCSR
jgi:hypothetical protein